MCFDHLVDLVLSMGETSGQRGETPIFAQKTLASFSVLLIDTINHITPNAGVSWSK